MSGEEGMTLYLLDINQELMDACEFTANNYYFTPHIDLDTIYPSMPNFWCSECEAWIAFPLKHLYFTIDEFKYIIDWNGHNIARAENIK